MRATPVLLVFVVCAIAQVAQAETQWNPQRTFVLVASITEWPPRAGLAPLNTEKRRDQDLVSQFKKAGVASEHIVFLKDSAATHASICNSLRSLAAKAGQGSTMIFYFQGHGGRKLFCCYDTDAKNEDETELHADEIFNVLNSSWKGDRLFLLGDCCSSGSMASIVHRFEKERPDMRVACFASATATNLSSSHWTFTTSLIRIFAGDFHADQNGDGKITVSEAGRFIHDQMKFQENQLAGYALTPSFEKDFVIKTAATGQRPPRIAGSLQIGDVIDARDSEGHWYASEIVGWNPRKHAYRVHFYGWDSKWDEWIGSSRLRPLVKPKLNVGQQYEVQWEDENWYRGTVTRSVEDWFYFVHYESEAGDDDEWVTPDRTRPPGKATAKEKPQFRAALPRALVIGDYVAAQWFRDWYRGRVTGITNGRTYFVRYDDQTTAHLASDDLIPISRPEELRAGERVLACWENKPRMFAGKIESIADGNATIRWEDGTPATQVPINAVAHIKP